MHVWNEYRLMACLILAIKLNVGVTGELLPSSSPSSSSSPSLSSSTSVQSLWDIQPRWPQTVQEARTLPAYMQQ